MTDALTEYTDRMFVDVTRPTGGNLSIAFRTEGGKRIPGKLLIGKQGSEERARCVIWGEPPEGLGMPPLNDGDLIKIVCKLPAQPAEFRYQAGSIVEVVLS